MTAAPNKIETLKRLIDEAERIVAFTGAGISTECGIPDFRSPGGLWTRYKPIPFQEFVSSAEKRREAWERYFKVYDAVRHAEPGRGHAALARLRDQGKLTFVITQNIDGLHHRSGVPAERIIELHGNGSYAHCLACLRRYELEWVREAMARTGPPNCEACGGIVKTATVSFGQPMPPDVMERAYGATEDCDLFLSLGSSLVVYPAATLPMLARRWGATLVIVNRESTPFDDEANLVIGEDIGETMTRVVA
jgi:NAD-dependent deacetylase